MGGPQQIQYRSFLNTDPPLIVDIWRSQKPFRGLAGSLTRNQLDQLILAKPYFEREGLILAVQDCTPLGFVHAGFVPTQSRDDLDYSTGIICQLRVVPGEQADTVAQGLLNAACQYLLGRGARECYAGSKFPFSPFYLGLYGGSRVPGLLLADRQAIEAFNRFGFQAQGKVLVFQRTLAGYRTIVDRRQMQIRRQYQVSAVAEPIQLSWWVSCSFGLSEHVRFQVVQRNSTTASGQVSFWDLQPLATSWGVSAMGMYDLKVAADHRRAGLATFLLSESLRHLSQQGVSMVESQVRQADTPAVGSLQKLGFQQVDSAVQLMKPLAAA